MSESKTPEIDAWCELAMDADVSSVLELAKEYEVKLHEANAKISKFEKLAGVYAQLLLANHMLEDRAVLLLGGLIEITRIKGSPPIQVARTIATRCINKVKERFDNEPINIEQIHPGTGTSTGTEEHEALNIPGPADRPQPAGEQGADSGDTKEPVGG